MQRKEEKIILTSDTWYDHNFVKKILIKFNINIFDKIYLSSSSLKSKLEGSIFKIIKEENKGNILHLGDNKLSDYKNPRKYGIYTFYLPSLNSIILNSSFSKIYAYNQSIFSQVLIGLIKKKISYLIYNNLNNKNFKIIEHSDLGYIFFGALNFFFQYI